MENTRNTVDLNEVSRITRDVVINGNVSSRSDIRVDGRIDGTLLCKGRVVVGEDALIKGTLFSNDTDLWGKIDGDITVRNLLSLKSSSNVTGGIKVKKIQVEIGAQINGTCHMITEEEYEQEFSRASGDDTNDTIF